jgi:hypothetical protein
MVGVPDSWANGSSTGQLTSQWCIGDGDKAAPTVARPGAQTDVGCGLGGHDDPGTLIENAGRFVAFDMAPDTPDGRSAVGDRVTVVRDGVAVLVQTEPELRDRVLATISTFDHDQNGCPLHHPVDEDASRRPVPAVAVTSLSGVTGAVACKYAVASGDGRSVGLVSSIEVRDPAAAVSAIAEAPVGGGPDRPQDCTVDTSYGEELIVILVEDDAGRHEIFLRYSGCDHNGFDDGTGVRALTAAAVPPFVTGANTVMSMSGTPAKARMVMGR